MCNLNMQKMLMSQPYEKENRSWEVEWKSKIEKREKNLKKE